MNVNTLIKNNPDLKIRNIIIDNIEIKIIYFESLCESSDINDFILKPITINKLNTISLIKNMLPSSNFKDINNEKDLLFCLYSGFTIINIKDKYVALETKYSLDSGINEASNEKVIKGPKDSFSENYQNNIGLIRKRIRTKKLKLKEYIIGNESKTKVSLFYLDDKVNKELLNEINNKFNNINLDYILNSNSIIDTLSNNSVFQDYIMTERPDYVTYNLINGRIAILVENTNQVIIIPRFFMDNFMNIDDNYQNYKNVNITRIIRFIAFIVAIITPSFYIALTTFNQETLPTSILINFSMQREGVPFPSFVEALILSLTFEILREADTRIPLVVGTSMSIVGALVLGEAAAKAGLISPIMIIVIAISSVSSLLFNDNDLVNTIRIYKIIFLIFSGIMGLYGLFISILILIIKICSLKSFNYDYLNNLKRFILRR